MNSGLNDVPGWTKNVLCVTTALCAITGKTPGEIAELLARLANDRGAAVSADPSNPFNIKDWLKALASLDLEWLEVEDFSPTPYAARKSISEYLLEPRADDTLLVFGEDSAGKMTHVFALRDDKLIDTYTDGKITIADPNKVPPDYNDFRVKRVFMIWPRGDAEFIEDGSTPVA